MKSLDELGVSPAPWQWNGHPAVHDIVRDNDGTQIFEFAPSADARLCAAAPELYEALREIYDAFDPCSLECHGCKHEPGCNKWARRARAALEKAGGAE